VMSLISLSQQVLQEAGCAIELTALGSREVLVFENDTVMGFVVPYESCEQLIEAWTMDSSLAVSKYQFGLRRAETKAWNTYMFLLTPDSADHSAMIALGAIEEDLRGTRKVVRARVRDGSDLRAAFLPLLPLQSAPRLDAIDMRDEIRRRTPELPERVLNAFLSDADEGVVLQVLEELL
jgi:hypothetical protein